MAKAGISKALVRREEQYSGGVVLGNQLITQDVKNGTNLWGIWSVVPEHTNEIPAPDTILQQMKNNRIAAWQFSPTMHGFTFHYLTLKTWLVLAQKANIPLFIQIGEQIKATDLLNTLEKYPHLTVIISIESVWPCDRIILPLLTQFTNCSFELSHYLADGGIEQLVSDIGANRILFGSGFYQSHFGGVMLMLKQAQITEDQKHLIAYKNMQKIIDGIKYDL